MIYNEEHKKDLCAADLFVCVERGACVCICGEGGVCVCAERVYMCVCVWRGVCVCVCVFQGKD